VVISGRLVHGWGDYDDTTDRPANFPPHDGDWEGIPTTDESYGWNPFDTTHKPPSHFVQLLAKAAARGGNVLLNIGPMGTGEIDPKDVAILKGIADWWKVNGESSIRGTARTPLPAQTWGETTIHVWSAKEHGPFVPGGATTIYLHVFDWPTNGQLVLGGLTTTNLGIAYLLADEYATPTTHMLSPLKVARLNQYDVGTSVPATPPDKADSVIILNCNSDLQADTRRLLQPEYPVETLRAFDAELHGKGLKFGPGKKIDDVVLNWAKADQSIVWPVRINQPAKYEVIVNYDAAADSAGGTFRVQFELSPEARLTMAPEIVTGTVKAGNARSELLGTVTVQGTLAEINIVPVSIRGGELMRLRSLQLKPVRGN
jgi:hypothetical protein